MRFHSLVAALVAFFLAASDARAVDKLEGRYVGIEDAEGAVIEIEPDPEGYTGTFYDRHGTSQEFLADAIGKGAAAVLDMDGRTVVMRMMPHPNGAQVTLVPVDETGKLLTGSATILGFLREGSRLPRIPDGFTKAPPDTCTRIAAYSFMASYALWEPKGVLNGFRCLPERTRTLLIFFPAVRLDIIARICQATGSGATLARALRKSSVSCDGVTSGVAAMKGNGRYGSFQEAVKRERDSLILSIRCAEGYPETRENCRAASRQLSRNAAEARTPAMVLQQFR